MESFSKFANVFPEIMLLVDSGGTILDLNNSAKQEFASLGIAPDKASLMDLSADPAAKLTEYLRLCSRTKNFLPGKISLTVAGNEPVIFRCSGTLYDPGEKNNSAMIILRLVPMHREESSFAVLNQQIENLSKEIRRRQQIEAELEAKNRQLSTLSGELREQRDVSAKNEERLHYALEGAGDAVWDWFIPDNKVFYSKRWRDILGFALDEAPDGYKAWESLVHSSDLPKVLKALDACLDNTVPNYMCEYRIWSKENKWVWVLGRGKVVKRDDKGKPVRMVGTVADISEKKALEEELDRSTNLLRDCASQMPGVIFQLTLGPRGRLSCTYISDRAVDFFGFLPSEIATDLNIVLERIPPADRDSLRISIMSSARDLQRWNHKFRIDLPGQGLMWLQGNAQPTRIDNGDTVWHGFITSAELAMTFYEAVEFKPRLTH